MEESDFKMESEEHSNFLFEQGPMDSYFINSLPSVDGFSLLHQFDCMEDLPDFNSPLASSSSSFSSSSHLLKRVEESNLSFYEDFLSNNIDQTSSSTAGDSSPNSNTLSPASSPPLSSLPIINVIPKIIEPSSNQKRKRMLNHNNQVSPFSNDDNANNNNTSHKTEKVLRTSPLNFSRDDLLKISSKGLDNYALSRSLTAEEEKQLKKQRRLIKNRESAQLSRLRKKVYIDEMESKYNNLMTEHEDVVKQLSQMATEKGKLEQEVVYLRNLLKNNSQISEGVQRRHLNARNLKKATVCMMIMFLSFGLIFQSESLRNNLSRE
eukprot:TRINITY_DN2551_c0_g1_i2.p1 TRINITY_DN2551_c0_g1~~TRINITY_DN2551_c0_g1_i2.p1  ORF type:complete len:322 (-),score=100.18 TRINITY_DN2551_c0_g1_i2:714-1679(-)